MQNTPSRDYHKTIPAQYDAEISLATVDLASHLNFRVSEIRDGFVSVLRGELTPTQAQALRDALLEAYPIAPKVPAVRYEVVEDIGGGYSDWNVYRITAAARDDQVLIASDLTEEHARVLADGMNAKVAA